MLKQLFYSRSHHWLFSLFLGTSVLLTSCNSQPNNTTSSSEDSNTLKLLYWQAPTILNPHLSTGLKDSEASRITLEPLASYDKNGELIPFLAAEIPSRENGGIAAAKKGINSPFLS